MFTAQPVEGDLASFTLLGLVINQATLDGALRGFKLIFQNAFDGSTTILDRLAITVPSSTKQEEYKWMGQFPGLREWLGDRVIKDLAVDGFVIKNRDFEETVSIGRNDFEDDTLGIYKPLFQGLGEVARQHPDILLFDLLVNGFAQTGFDGEFFFDTDHPNGEQAAWSNKGTAVLATDGVAYDAARVAMMSLLNEEGRPLRVIPDTLIVPPQSESVAKTLLRADKTASGATNIWKDSADIMVVPELAANPTYWFLAATKRAVKPFIFQTRRAVELTALDNVKDENVFMRKEYIYGVDYRGNAGYGLPHLIYGSTGGG